VGSVDRGASEIVVRFQAAAGLGIQFTRRIAEGNKAVESFQDRMRAFYSTHKGTRFFVLGTPEGWHVLTLDVNTGEWMNGTVHETLKNAKVAAEEKATSMFGKKPVGMKWH
jgi:hypothetical protein